MRADQSAMSKSAVIALSTVDIGGPQAGSTTAGASLGVSSRGVLSEIGAVAQSSAHNNASSSAGSCCSVDAQTGLALAPTFQRQLERSRAEKQDEGSEAQCPLNALVTRSSADQQEPRYKNVGCFGEMVGGCVNRRVDQETRAGDALRAELELEVLHDKRRRLVQLSRDVLEVRCPGFCQGKPMSDDVYLREAAHALASISEDVHAEAQSLRIAMPWRGHVEA